MRFQITIVLLAIAMTPVSAQERERAFGAGANTCAEFAELYRRQPTSTELISYSWAQGFMSALNLMQGALHKPPHDLNAWSTSDQESHIRGYCRDKPLAYYVEAVKHLFDEPPEISK